jgi:copper chaperone CopZ
MLQTKSFLVVLLVLVFLIGCNKAKNESSTENKPADTKAAGEIVKINVPTIQCGTCKKNIESALKKVEGINSVNVSVKEKITTVDYDKSKTSLDKIETEINHVGYDANGKKKDEAAYEKLADCCKIGGHDQ